MQETIFFSLLKVKTLSIRVTYFFDDVVDMYNVYLTPLKIIIPINLNSIHIIEVHCIRRI